MSITPPRSCFNYLTPPSTPPRSPKRKIESKQIKFPKTPRPRIHREPSPYQNKTNEILTTHQFQVEERVYSLGKKIGAGNFSKVFELVGKDPYHQDYKNEDLVVKIYRRDSLKKSQLEINRMNQNVKDQYNELHSNPNFPLKIAKILNIDTFETDGYIIQEKVTPYDNTTQLEQTKGKLKATFKFCFEKKCTSLDLKPDNLGWNKQKELTLIDYFEFREKNEPFDYIIPNCLYQFSPVKDSNYQYLDPRPISTSPLLDFSVLGEQFHFQDI